MEQLERLSTWRELLMRVSICIPTYNRASHLRNCLHSIISNQSRSAIDFEVCVSDNCSTDETEKVVRCAQESIDIKYHKNLEIKSLVAISSIVTPIFFHLIGNLLSK